MLLAPLRLAACAAALLLVPVFAAVPAHAASRPNVLLVVTDDQRAEGTLQVMPRTREWLGAGGRTFPLAFATTPLCCPSRASIFSGLYAHNHGIFMNTAQWDQFDATHSVERAVKQAGYVTALVGKYFGLTDLREDPPFFDEVAVTNGGYRKALWRIDGRRAKRKPHSELVLRSSAIRYLRRFERRDDARPWFMTVATPAPHLPMHPERRFARAKVGTFPASLAPAETDLSDKPPHVRDGGLAKGRRFGASTRAGQLRLLMSVDRTMGALRAELRRLGEERNTLVIFTSDNGLLWGEHGGMTMKDVPYDASTRVPMMVRWPGHVRGRGVDRRLAANVDIVPTILAATGLGELGRHTDGHDLLGPVVRDRLLLEYGGLPDKLPAWAALRTRNELYVENYGMPEGGLPALPVAYRGDVQRGWPDRPAPDSYEASFRELYDVIADPRQQSNTLAGARLAANGRTDELAEQLRAALRCRGPSCP